MNYLQHLLGTFYNYLPERTASASFILLLSLSSLQAQELGDHQYTTDAIERGSRISVSYTHLTLPTNREV